jgi:hypothetical protein
MKNEVLCKFLAHNLCCVIQSQLELGIAPVFWQDSHNKGTPAPPTPAQTPVAKPACEPGGTPVGTLPMCGGFIGHGIGLGMPPGER